MKNIKFFVLLALLGFLGWYFFLKRYDYKITFKTKNPTGVVFNTLTGWNNWEPPRNKAVLTHSKAPYSNLKQELHVSDSLIDIQWNMVRESDSVTKVIAYVTDREHSFLQKLKVPFVKTDFVNRTVSIAKRMQKELNALRKEYRVGGIQTSKTPKQFCAYMNLQSKLGEKASKMMASNAHILNYLEDHHIAIKGHPFLEVTSWNEQEATMTYNFCFPVAYSETYPPSTDIKFKTTTERPALKTVFNGNYRISDCAWFTMIDHANQNKINIDKLPTEVFFNDPHEGGDELQWKAEVYMPLKTD